MHKVTLGNTVLDADENEVLSNVLIRNNISFPHPCGGKGICKKCKVIVNGKEELSCKYEVTSDIEVILPQEENITSETGAKISNYDNKKVGENTCFILDIGTTTLALALIDFKSKKILEVKTATNPQRVFGADIMSRIDYCTKNGTEKLQEILINKINELIKGFNLIENKDLLVSANATMLHIFFGVSPDSIGVAPYKASFLDFKHSNGRDLGLDNINNVTSLPSVHAFVGADIVAGMNYIGMPQKAKFNLLIDLGTNAEVVLYSEDFAVSTAAAAGPCFEGANIDCGMSATRGAISTFKYNKGDFTYETIENAEPLGICGTGLVDIISELLKNGTIDSTGFMDEDFKITDKVFLSQKDVRQYQLAKSAVYSAIIALMKIKGVSFDDIEGMYISGGFSGKINIENAVSTGLLPKELISKCKPINNSALLGTIKYKYENNDLDIYLKNSEYIDLAMDLVFSELFVDNMEF